MAEGPAVHVDCTDGLREGSTLTESQDQAGQQCTDSMGDAGLKQLAEGDCTDSRREPEGSSRIGLQDGAGQQLPSQMGDIRQLEKDFQTVNIGGGSAVNVFPGASLTINGDVLAKGQNTEADKSRSDEGLQSNLKLYDGVLLYATEDHVAAATYVKKINDRLQAVNNLRLVLFEELDSGLNMFEFIEKILDSSHKVYMLMTDNFAKDYENLKKARIMLYHNIRKNLSRLVPVWQDRQQKTNYKLTEFAMLGGPFLSDLDHTDPNLQQIFVKNMTNSVLDGRRQNPQNN